MTKSANNNPVGPMQTEVASLACGICRDAAAKHKPKAPIHQDPADGHGRTACASFQSTFDELRNQEGMPCNSKRGRRPKMPSDPSSGPPLYEDLWPWLGVRRAHTYDVQCSSSLTLFCRFCNVQVKAIRANTIYWVLQHEARPTHQCHVVKGPSCSGINLRKEGSSLEGATVLQAFQSWLERGAPWSTPSIQHQCALGKNGEIIVRSQRCLAEAKAVLPGRPGCAQCMELACRGRFLREVCRCAYCFDLIYLLHATYAGSLEKRQDAIDKLQQGLWQGSCHVFVSVDFAPAVC